MTATCAAADIPRQTHRPEHRYWRGFRGGLGHIGQANWPKSKYQLPPNRNLHHALGFGLRRYRDCTNRQPFDPVLIPERYTTSTLQML